VDLQHCIVVIGGDAPSTPLPGALGPDAVVVAADSGVDHALALGLRVDVAVGDFDSVTPAGLDEARAGGARVESHPSAKDHTDLELALEAAVATGAGTITVVGGDGGRRDHLFANLLVLAAPRFAAPTITAYLGATRVHVVHGGRRRPITGEPGELVTLLPVHGDAAGVRTEGLRYPLANETLPAGTSRGVSNVLERSPASVAVSAGTVVVVLPGAQDEGA